MSYFNDVRQFHHEILNVQDSTPHMLNLQDTTARINFMDEELEEYRDAVRLNDIVAAADALADLVYVACGTAHMMGLPFNEIWGAVQKANMGKKRGMTKRGVECDAMKPPGWVGPEAEIQQLIAIAMNN
jgi:predicted HAD superfamily Cof-like phosphohydrolase